MLVRRRQHSPTGRIPRRPVQQHAPKLIGWPRAPVAGVVARCVTRPPQVSPVSELVARPTILSGPLRLGALMLTSKDPLAATMVRLPRKIRAPLSVIRTCHC